MSLSGRTLAGRYRIEELLGAGSYGEVYAATQIDLGRPVALKALNPQVALTTDGLARFEREARAAAALGHPNIALVTDFQNNPNEPPFLVMERLHGRTLGEALDREGRLPAPRIAWIAHQVLAALDVAHRAGIVHRDVKAANIFLVSAPGIDDFVKLLDFGVAKLAPADGSKLTASGAMLGSPAYMAPEQIGGFPFDARVDIYALGATMYRAASGKLPFDATSLPALMAAIAAGNPTPLSAFDPNIDPNFVAVVARAMHRDANARYASASEMRAALEPFLAHSARSSRRISSDVPTNLTSPHPPPPMAGPPPMTFGPPGGPPPGFAPAPMSYAPPPGLSSFAAAPPPKKGNGAIVALLVVVVLLLLLIAAGVGGFLFYSRAGTDSMPTASSATPTTSAAANATPTDPTTVPAAPTPTPPALGPNGKPVPRPDAGVIVIVDAGAPGIPGVPGVGQKQMAGSVVVVSGGIWGSFLDEKEKIFAPYIPSLNACYAKTEFMPPEHQYETVNLFVDAAGNSTNVTSSGPAHPVLFPCVAGVLRSMKWPKRPAGQQIQVSLRSRTKDNQ